MDLQRVNELIKKITAGSATEAEQQELTSWYRETAYQDATFPGEEQQVHQELLQRINRATGQRSARTGYRQWAAAASIALLCATGFSIYFIRHKTVQHTTYAASAPVKPGSNLATLTLANGSRIVLSNTANGNIATQGNVRITKAANGQLVYHIDDIIQPANDSTETRMAYNTITTPAGGQYMIVLPDRTTVWLNAMSSLKFPVTFANAKERRVELTGEGYFEVTHNEAAPFKVATGAFITEDLGTIFDIKAYADEPGVSTTLVKGAAQVSAGNTPTVLKPGEQARYLDRITVSQANVDAVIAWKEGYFRFDDEPLENIMRTIARWYNVRYVFEDERLRKETFGAVTTRFSNIATLLSLMEKAGDASFHLEGNTIIIRKKQDQPSITP